MTIQFFMPAVFPMGMDIVIYGLVIMPYIIRISDLHFHLDPQC